VTVADPASADRRAVTAPGLAGRPQDEAAAGARAVAHSIEPAGRRVRGRADAGAAGRPTGRHERAQPRRAGGVAGLARFRTGAVAADAVDTESTGAVPAAPAGGAVGPAHRVGAAASGRRRFASAVVDRAVGARCARTEAASGGAETDPTNRDDADEPCGSRIKHFAKRKPGSCLGKTRARSRHIIVRTRKVRQRLVIGGRQHRRAGCRPGINTTSGAGGPGHHWHCAGAIDGTTKCRTNRRPRSRTELFPKPPP
jgi:hypothetical protein